jgi:arginyl-tRNA synthetase
MQEIQRALKSAVKDLFNEDLEPELTRPEEQFGDYSTNAAMQLAAKTGKPPREIAEALAAKLRESKAVDKTEIAGPVFINVFLTDETIIKGLDIELIQKLEGKEILVEFGDPNPFKEMHIGHLYSYIVGDAISRLFEAQGATVRRLSYHGDVGLHVAKAIYGLRANEKQRKEDWDKSLSDVPTIEREDFLGIAYAYGNDKYDNDSAAKEEIDKINQQIYARDNPEINKLHEQGRELSFSYFDNVLGLLNIHTDKRYLESQTVDIGTKYVQGNIGKVFKESEGAVIFDGEKAGLHTRVFLTSQGLPTYEAKDLGLAELKNKDYPQATRSIIITAHEQAEYFKVMLAALAEIDAVLAKKTTHLTHGFLSLSSGKMSSRSGNVLAAMKLLLEVKEAVHQQYPDSKVRKEVTFAAVKFALLKHRLGTDIALDIKESINLEGSSGPYLQYAYVRATGILSKGTPSQPLTSSLEEGERSLARKIGEFPEVVETAANELLPSNISTYLYELAQIFNRFYENNRVIGDEREAFRLKLVEAYAKALKNGLQLLNIPVVERM